MTSALEQGSAAIDGLRVILRTAGYTKDAVAAATSVTDAVASPSLSAIAAYVQTDRDDPLAVLARLFTLGAPEKRERVERVLPDLDVDALAAAGVLQADGDNVSSPLRIDEVYGLLVAWDLDRERDDFVVGVSPSTMLAATHAPRARAGSALDVGTGTGLHALLAARHCDRVVATDFNPRACWMTELNARLNQVGNIETRVGSFFEPVEGERFDLVVVNPAVRDLAGRAVPVPRRRLRGRRPVPHDAGRAAALPGGRRLRHAPVQLDPRRRRALVRADRARPGGQRLRRGHGAHHARLSRSSTRRAGTRPHHIGDERGYQRVLREWVGHFESHGIERISSAMVVLRRRPGARNWRRAVSLARRPETVDGVALAELFDTQDRLDGLDDDGLLATHLLTPPELRVERFERPGEAPGACSTWTPPSASGGRSRPRWRTSCCGSTAPLRWRRSTAPRTSWRACARSSSSAS